MLLEEIQNHVASTADIRRIHRHLAEEILHVRLDDGERSESVPKVVKSEKTLGTTARALILERHERTSEFHGVRHIVAQKRV